MKRPAGKKARARWRKKQQLAHELDRDGVSRAARISLATIGHAKPRPIRRDK
jgi:hypothetical protein